MNKDKLNQINSFESGYFGAKSFENRAYRFVLSKNKSNKQCKSTNRIKRSTPETSLFQLRAMTATFFCRYMKM